MSANYKLPFIMTCVSPRRVSLCTLPTPCHRLPDLARGTEVWIKRDDLTGFAFGGNKGRKLEFLLADLQDRGVKTVVSCGATQSNFIRQLAAACRVGGIEFHAVVMDMPYDAAAGIPAYTPKANNGNRRLTERFGAHLHVMPNDDWEVLYAHMERIADELRPNGKVEVIPVGGSTYLGAYAFYLAAQELEEPFDHIVFASSSGSTHVGLATAFAGTDTRVLGIAVDPEPGLIHDFADLSASLSEQLGLAQLNAEDFLLDMRFVGDGYGVPSPAGEAAFDALLSSTGIVLDSTYTAKAYAGLLHGVRSGELTGRILFWHTGGTPLIFAEP